MSSRRGSHVLIHSNEMNDKMKTENNPQMKRRLSLRPSDRAQNESIAPLLALTDSILQNVPGSVAATPGDEISRQVFEKAYEKNSKEGETHPTQRPNLYRKDTTKFSSNTESVCNVPNGVALNAEVSVDSTIPLPPMTFTNPPKTIWRVIAVCILSFSGGVSDGAPGALLPYIEDYYKISYSVVSLIWMSTAIGFILVALFSHKITSWLGGIQRCITFGSMITSIMYIFVLTGSKFPLIVTGFFFGGVGLAINLSQMNIFLTGLEKSSTALGYCHGSYGFGASVSPLIATQFIDRGIPWHYFYLILLGLMLLNVVNCFFAFQGAAEDMAPWNEVSTEDSIEDSNTIKHDEGNDELINHNNETDIGMQNMGGSSIPERQPRPPSDMSLALKNRVTWLLSLFVLFYQGSEVSMGGWIVTYLLDYREGNPKTVGYVASGFWFGLTLGRLFLTRLFHKHVGARRGVIIMAIISIVCVILTWVLPSVPAAGVCVSVAGVFIGPTYPLMITLAAKILPRKIQVVSLTIMTAFGSSGGAIFPFLVGLISQFTGAFVVLPIFIALYSTMLIAWILLPNIEQRDRHTGGKLTWWQKLW